MNQSISYAANFSSVRLSSASRIRRFLIPDVVSLFTTCRFFVVEELENAFDGAVNDDVDVDADEFVDEGGESVATAENDGGDTTTDEPTTFLLVDTANDLPFLAFVGGLFTVLALIATDVGFVVFDGRLV